MFITFMKFLQSFEEVTILREGQQGVVPLEMKEGPEFRQELVEEQSRGFKLKVVAD